MIQSSHRRWLETYPVWRNKGFKTVEMVNALTGSLKELKGFFEMLRKEELHPGLYMFIFDDKTGLISDLKPVVQFK